jgi:hypothetical protein
MDMLSKKSIAIISSIIAGVFLLGITVAIVNINHSKRKQAVHITPDLEEIRSICSLATTELEYNNVAKTTKYYWFFGKKEKKLWIEHKGVVKIGIDVNKIEVIPEGNKWTIRIPKAEVLSANCDEKSFTDESYTMSKSILRRFSAKEQNSSMADAIKNMETDAANNSAILRDAQVRAKKILKNYFLQLNKKTKANIQIKWELL